MGPSVSIGSAPAWQHDIQVVPNRTDFGVTRGDPRKVASKILEYSRKVRKIDGHRNTTFRSN